MSHTERLWERATGLHAVFLEQRLDGFTDCVLPGQEALLAIVALELGAEHIAREIVQRLEATWYELLDRAGYERLK